MIDASFQKRNDWVRDNYLDWSNYAEFSEVPPQTISSVTVGAPTPTGITLSAGVVAGTSTYWTTSGGTPGVTYTAEVTITTNLGKTLTAIVAFAVYS